MEKRKLGRSGIEVPPMGMGCWAIGGVWRISDREGGWGEVDDAESIRAVQFALDNGVSFFDTAANYGAGHSETILRQALDGRRDQAVIATKFGWNVNEATKHVMPQSAAEIIANVRAECEASLRRLGTDRIDLYQLHVWDFSVEQVDELVDVLEALVREGKIRTYGWSTGSVEGARAMAKGKHCAAIQHNLNVVKDAPEMLTVCAELNLASVNRSPLLQGALTGKYNPDTTFPDNDFRRRAWSREEFLIPTLQQLEAVREVLTSGGRTLAQGALAWIWSRSEQTIPIPGIRTVAQAAENAGAMRFGPLTPEQMSQIEELLRGPVAETGG